MRASIGSAVGEVLPDQAWTILKEEKNARIIDVRTLAEWSYVGVPDVSGLGHELICIEWLRFPDMSVNPAFVEDLLDQMEGQTTSKLLFLCRSGVRSLAAAKAVGDALGAKGIGTECLNVAEGFEGDLDANGHRGSVNGWKYRGLAWRQS